MKHIDLFESIVEYDCSIWNYKQS